MKRIGILTGGGDAPGLNAVIRAVVILAAKNNIKVIGIKNGWKGIRDNDTMDLDKESVYDIVSKGGTILGTSRTNPYKNKEDVAKIVDTYKKLGFDALVAIGGEDTLGVANKLMKEGKGLNIVGVPKTIDNDLSATDFTFGFDTAVNIATEAIDRLRTTAESHHRVMIVEVMGRHAGWIGLYSGIAGGADMILLPEEPVDIDDVCNVLKDVKARGRQYAMIVVSEGATFKEGQFAKQKEQLDSFGHVRLGGIGEMLAGEIEKRIKFETRVTVLGHLQRGGRPSTFDRVLGTRFGVKAMELVLEGKFGQMVSLSGNEIKSVALDAGVGVLKTVDKKFFDMAKIFFG